MKFVVLSLFSIAILESAWAQDLQGRLRELEGRFSNLEYRLSKLETGDPRNVTENPWGCSLNVLGITYVGTGRTRGIASAMVIKKCMDSGGTSVTCKPAAAICSND